MSRSRSSSRLVRRRNDGTTTTTTTPSSAPCRRPLRGDDDDSSSRSRTAPPPVVFPAEPKPLVTYNPSTTPWQSRSDLSDRRLMIVRIISLTRHHSTHRQQHHDRDELEAKAPSIARRVELSLYSRAASLKEYNDLTTLQRRLQSLVALSYHEAATIAYVRQMGRKTSNKRKRHRRNSSRMWTKRPRRKRGVVTTTTTPRQCYLFDTDDLVRLVYGFLDATEAWTHMTLNRMAHAVLPRCLSTVFIPTSMLDRGLHQHGLDWFSRFCPHVRTLQVFNAIPGQARPDPSSVHAGQCKTLDLAQSNLGEIVVKNLSMALAAGMCPQLEHLWLMSLFSNTSEINGMHHLSQALRSGTCPHLRSLVLSGNSAADTAVAELAHHVLASGIVPHLERLDLRRNYIGEGGMASLMIALASGQVKALQYLCLGGNIVTDESVTMITAMLQRRSCPSMRFLGLEDNFISSTGVRHIMQAATSGGMVPKLHKLCQRKDGMCSCARNPPGTTCC